MERLYADIGSGQSPLEQTPEVLDSVGMDMSANVTFDVVDNVVHVGVFGDERIGRELIGDDIGINLLISRLQKWGDE